MNSKSNIKPVELKPPTSGTFSLSTSSEYQQQPYHFHEELELLCVVKGQASLFAGNYAETCSEGDVFLIGKNLAHAIHRNDDQPEEASEIITLHFKEDFLGDRFFLIREFLPVEDLFKRSIRGIKWKGAAGRILPLLLHLRESAGVSSITTILSLFTALAKETQHEILNQVYFSHEHTGQEAEKITKVFAYTEEHYKEAISLAQISSVINFTETSFCRYFKMQTGKSYFHYLNEVRIDNACRILLENETKDIEEVCFTCGFSSPSTFYKQFKKIVKLTPKEYQQRGRKRMSATQVA